MPPGKQVCRNRQPSGVVSSSGGNCPRQMDRGSSSILDNASSAISPLRRAFCVGEAAPANGPLNRLVEASPPPNADATIGATIPIGPHALRSIATAIVALDRRRRHAFMPAPHRCD
jgi:hypothetical protein